MFLRGAAAASGWPAGGFHKIPGGMAEGAVGAGVEGGNGLCRGGGAGDAVVCPEAVAAVCANNSAGTHATAAANATPSTTVRNWIRVNKLFLLLNIFSSAVLLLRAKITDCRRRLQANVVVWIVLA